MNESVDILISGTSSFQERPHFKGVLISEASYFGISLL